MILDEFFKSKSTAVLAEGHGNYAGDRPVNLGGVSMKKIQIGDTVIYIDQKAQVVDMSQDREHARITIPSSSTTKTVLTSDLRSLGRGMAEDNLHGGNLDDEVKFFIDSEPAYYAVMDRFGDHIEFRGDDMVAPLRLWGAIQQTAGDAGGAADIAGLEDEPMWVGDELDEQGVAEGSENLNYIGNCTDDDVIEHIFGDATGFAQAVDEYGDEFTLDDLVVKYDPETDVHSFYYKEQGVAEGSTTRGGFSGSASQAQHEIQWTKNKIETLKPLLAKRPSVARQIKDLERQIRERELAIAYQKEGVAEDALSELSPATLARYKTKASAAATAADSTGDRKTGDRRFSGIVKATKKQFDQDAKQSAQAVHESRLRLMASIIKGQ